MHLSQSYKNALYKKNGQLLLKLSDVRVKGVEKMSVFEKIVKYSMFTPLYTLLVNNLAHYFSLIIIANQ